VPLQRHLPGNRREDRSRANQPALPSNTLQLATPGSTSQRLYQVSSVTPLLVQWVAWLATIPLTGSRGQTLPPRLMRKGATRSAPGLVQSYLSHRGFRRCEIEAGRRARKPVLKEDRLVSKRLSFPGQKTSMAHWSYSATAPP
jgi:hypothetical protein